MSIQNEVEKKILVALDFFKQELKAFRTGRASAALVDHISVEVYGTNMKLADTASISIPEPRMIVISPFDITNLHIIAKAIIAANLNLQPQVEDKIIRIKVPEPDQELRKELVKQAKKKCEQAKITIRNIRREANDRIKKEKTDGLLTEDLMKSLEKQIQTLIDKYCKIVDDITKEKEKEITSI